MSYDWSDIHTALAKAKLSYQDALTQVDAKLRHAVRQDPKNLENAKALQESYHRGFKTEPLGGAEMLQPAGSMKHDVTPADTSGFTHVFKASSFGRSEDSVTDHEAPTKEE